MPYKLLKSDDSGSESTASEGEAPKRHRSEKTKSKGKAKDKSGDKAKDKAKDKDEGKDKAKQKVTGDLFLKNEWTQVVLKALHRMLQKVEAHCGVSTQLLTGDSDGKTGNSETDSDTDENNGGATGKRQARVAEQAKELKDATLEGWKRLVATVPHLDTAANYVLGLYLHTQVAPDQDFVVHLPRLPPFEVVLLAFINNMHDNKAALLQYWTLPVAKKHAVLEDNLKAVLRRLVRPAMKTVKADGSPTGGDNDEEDDNPVRTVYLDEAHPLSGKQ